MIKKIICIFLFLNLSFLCSMEQADTIIENKLGDKISDDQLRKIKGKVTDDLLEKFKTDNHNITSYYNSNSKNKSNEDKKKLLLQLTYYFNKDSKIYLLNKNTDNSNVLGDILQADQDDIKQSFLKDLCLYTDYYVIKNDTKKYSILNHKYAQFFMCIDDISKRKTYIEKNKKILSLWQNNGPTDDEIISQFMQPDTFLNNVINPISMNVGIKKAFFKTYLNNFLEGEFVFLGYCYFFNYLFEKIFENTSLENLINKETKKLESCVITANKLTDTKDNLSLLLEASSGDEVKNLIKTMVNDKAIKDTITNIFKGENVFSKDNQVILKIRELFKNNQLLLDNILNLFDTKDRALIEQNIKNSIDSAEASAKIESELEEYIKSQHKSVQEIYKNVFNGQDGVNIEYDAAAKDFLESVKWNPDACVYLIEKLINNKIANDKIIDKVNVFLKNVNINKKEFLGKILKLIPKTSSLSYTKDKKIYFVVYASENSDLYNNLKDEDRNTLLTCFAVPGIEYDVVFKAITDHNILAKVQDILKSISDEEKILVLQEMAKCFAKYQEQIFVFGYTIFFNWLTVGENILDFLLRGGSTKLSKSKYSDIENNFTEGKLFDSLDPYSSSFNLNHFFIALDDLNDNPYKKAWLKLFSSPDKDLQKKILITLINCILEKRQDPIVLSANTDLTDTQIGNIVKVLNSLIQYGSAGKTILEQVITEQNLPIEYKNNQFMRKPLTENEQFQSTYRITKEQAAKNINAFLKDNILTKKSLTDVDKNAIKWIVQTHVDQLNDDSFLELINADFLNDLGDTFFNDLKHKFFAIEVNKHKFIQVNDDDNRYILILNDFAPVYRKLTTNQQDILKKINCFDSSRNTDEEYHTIYKKILDSDSFSETLKLLQQPIIDRSSKTGTQQNNFDKNVCMDFLDIFLDKLKKYNETSFVFGSCDFITKVYQKYLKNTSVSTTVKNLDFLSTNTNLDLFLAEIQKNTQDHNNLKKAMVNGLSAYVRHTKKEFGLNTMFSLDYDDKNNLIKKLCDFLKYNIANINWLFKELKVNKQNKDLADAILSGYQRYTKQNNSTLKLDENNDYYQLVDSSKRENPVKDIEEDRSTSKNPQQLTKEKQPKSKLTEEQSVIVASNSDKETKHYDKQIYQSDDPAAHNKKEDPKSNEDEPNGQGVSFFGVLSTIGSVLAWPFKTFFNFVTSFLK